MSIFLHKKCKSCDEDCNVPLLFHHNENWQTQELICYLCKGSFLAPLVLALSVCYL